MSATDFYPFSGTGNKDLGRISLSRHGTWRMRIQTENLEAVAKITLSNGQAYVCDCKPEKPEHEYAYAYWDLPIRDETLYGNLVVSATSTTRWTLTLSIINEAKSPNANLQVGKGLSVETTTPEHVCVRRTDRLNVRSGPGYSNFPKVDGGDIDKGGGAVPGIRYSVIRTVQDGQLVSGDPIWHEIDFKPGITGWLSGFYADPC